MRFFSNSSPPSYLAKWHRAGGNHELQINGEVILTSEVPPVNHYKVLEEVSPYNHRLLYHGTDQAQAERVWGSIKGGKIKIETSQGLPDFHFSIDRAREGSVQITAHDNDANGCLLEATINGSHGFEIETDGEVLAKHRTEGGRTSGSGTFFTVMAVLTPGKSLTIKYSGNREKHQISFQWDGTLMKTSSGFGRDEINSPVSNPWSALDQLKINKP